MISEDDAMKVVLLGSIIFGFGVFGCIKVIELIFNSIIEIITITLEERQIKKEIKIIENDTEEMKLHIEEIKQGNA